MGAEHISGEVGAVGSKMMLRYKIRKREMNLEETVLENNLPDTFVGEYATDTMTNTMANTFFEVNDSETRWEAEIHYTALNGWLIKVMAFLFPGMFKKQTQKWLNQFKSFVENRSQAN